MNKAVVLAAVSASIVSASLADTKYSVANDGNNQYSFSRANWKAAGDAAASAPTSGNDYIAIHTINAGGGNSSYTDAFIGDSLQIGEVGGTAGTMAIYKSGKVQVPNMILANGRIWNRSADWTAQIIAGTTTVVSPASAPFALGYQVNNTSQALTYPMTFGADHHFVGDETSALYIDMPKATLTLKGGSPDYLGKWSFAQFRWAQVVLGCPDALGGDRTNYAADAISVSRNMLAMTLDFDGAMPSAGRGISIAHNLVMNVTTGKVECTMPITRTDNTRTLTVAGGVGALKTMDGSTMPEARPGFVSDGRDALMLGTVAVPTTVNSGTLCVTNFMGGVFTLKSKARIAARIHRDGTADATSFAEGTTLTVEDAKIPLHVYGTFPLTNATTRIAVLKMPTSVRTLTESDIELTTDDFDLMEKTLEIVTDGGVQTVYLTMTGKVVYYSNYVNGAFYNMGKAYWSDNKEVHNDANYLIGYDVPANCYTIRGADNGQSFKGKTLTMAPGTLFLTKGTPTTRSTVSDMRCWAGSIIRNGVAGTNVITGNISLRGNPADGGVALAIAANNTSFRIDAGISGSIPLIIQNLVDTSTENIRACEITSENPSFTGPVETSKYRTILQGIRLILHSELNLGGNPESFNAEQLRFSCKTTLEAADTLVLDDTNRGLTVTAPCTFDVGSGKSLTLGIPMVFNGFSGTANVKTGAGTLGIGGTVSGNSASLSVSEGYVQPVTRAGSSAVKYTFADGAGLELALSPSDADVAADGLYVIDSSHLTIQGASLPVVVKGAVAEEGKSVKLGIVNVPSAIADSVGSKLGAQVSFTDTATGLTHQYPIERKTLDGGRVRFYAAIGKDPTLMVFR